MRCSQLHPIFTKRWGDTCLLFQLQCPTESVSPFTVSSLKRIGCKKQGYPRMCPWREKAWRWSFFVAALWSNLCLVLTSYKGGGKINSLYNICIVFRIADIHTRSSNWGNTCFSSKYHVSVLKWVESINNMTHLDGQNIWKTWFC